MLNRQNFIVESINRKLFEKKSRIDKQGSCCMSSNIISISYVFLHSYISDFYIFDFHIESKLKNNDLIHSISSYNFPHLNFKICDNEHTDTIVVTNINNFINKSLELTNKLVDDYKILSDTFKLYRVNGIYNLMTVSNEKIYCVIKITLDSYIVMLHTDQDKLGRVNLLTSKNIDDVIEFNLLKPYKKNFFNKLLELCNIK